MSGKTKALLTGRNWSLTAEPFVESVALENSPTKYLQVMRPANVVDKADPSTKKR